MPDPKKELIDRLGAILHLSPMAWAIDFEGRLLTWGELGSSARAVCDALHALGVKGGLPVAWLAHNQPEAIAGALGIILSGNSCFVVNPHRPKEAITNELGSGGFACVVGSNKAALELSRQFNGPMVLVEEDLSVILKPPEEAGYAQFEPAGDVAAVLLSSGTTGEPKRVPSSWSEFQRMLTVAARTKDGGVTTPSEPQRSPSLLVNPVSHTSGTFAMFLALYHARPIVLFRKFDLHAWLDAVGRHRPRLVSLVPTLVGTLLDADIDPSRLAGLAAIRVGTAPLDPEVQARFEDKFGVPILIDYGATEFKGSVTSWTLEDHRRYPTEKRGTVGRAAPGMEVRIVDPSDGRVLPTGEIGLVDVKRQGNGEVWVRTTDLGHLDGDGFLFLHGRNDDAIIRGGFKILPEAVEKILRKHPSVSDVAVVAVPDDRLGQVPVAVVELVSGASIEVSELDELARQSLAAYQTPVGYITVAELPRTASLKIKRAQVREWAASDMTRLRPARAETF